MRLSGHVPELGAIEVLLAVAKDRQPERGFGRGRGEPNRPSRPGCARSRLRPAWCCYAGAPAARSGTSMTLGYVGIARLLFGFGVISWVFIGILPHHPVGPQRLPTALVPTLAILIAPPIVAGNAWFAINGDRADGIALGLAGYGGLMAVTQLGLIPAYRRVPFGPGWWSFSFPYAATAGTSSCPGFSRTRNRGDVSTAESVVPDLYRSAQVSHTCRTALVVCDTGNQRRPP